MNMQILTINIIEKNIFLKKYTYNIDYFYKDTNINFKRKGTSYFLNLQLQLNIHTI